MNFVRTDEQNLLADSAGKWVERAYGEKARAASLAHEHGCSPARWGELAELGWLALLLPESCGGLGRSLGDAAVIAEALGRGLVVEPYVASAVLAAPLLEGAGGAEVWKAWLEASAAGEKRIVLAAFERQSRYCGCDVATAATATPAGFRLRGEKHVVFGAPGADALLVLARTAGGPREPDGLSLFLVAAAAPGVHARSYATYDGLRASTIALDTEVPASALVGAAGAAWPHVERALDRATLAVCAEAVGTMSVALDTTLAYLKTRQQFGHVLAGYQALQHRLVDMYVAIEESRALTGAAAVAFARAGDEERRRYASAAKVRVCQAARLVAEESVQLHGAIGMTEEYPLGRYVKRLGAMQTQFGDADFHLERLAGLERPDS